MKQKKRKQKPYLRKSSPHYSQRLAKLFSTFAAYDSEGNLVLSYEKPERVKTQKGGDMEKYNWSKLSSIQLGRYAEYYAKMEFTLLGFDVYEPEVDDKGIDFIICKGEDNFYEIQVKSNFKGNYIFMQKDKFALRKNLYLVLVLFIQGNSPELYLIPSTAWLKPNELLVSHDYLGEKSKPEWGINLSKKNSLILSEYEFDKVAKTIL